MWRRVVLLLGAEIRDRDITPTAQLTNCINEINEFMTRFIFLLKFKINVKNETMFRVSTTRVCSVARLEGEKKELPPGRFVKTSV